jgi:hypothetical protein
MDDLRLPSWRQVGSHEPALWTYWLLQLRQQTTLGSTPGIHQILLDSKISLRSSASAEDRSTDKSEPAKAA